MTIELDYYRPQGKVMFSQASVSHPVHREGLHPDLPLPRRGILEAIYLEIIIPPIYFEYFAGVVINEVYLPILVPIGVIGNFLSFLVRYIFFFQIVNLITAKMNASK